MEFNQNGFSVRSWRKLSAYVKDFFPNGKRTKINGSYKRTKKICCNHIEETFEKKTSMSIDEY